MKLLQVEELGTQFSYSFLLSRFVVENPQAFLAITMISLKITTKLKPLQPGFQTSGPSRIPKQTLQHRETEIKMTSWICFGPELVEMKNEPAFENSLVSQDPRFY